MIAIIDYGRGNLGSVEKAFQFLGADVVITADADIIQRADKLVLPGVGAFGDAVDSLHNSGLFQVVQQALSAQKPLLGICLGMQLLFEASEESPGYKGFGVFCGSVKRFPPADKVPHVGWNSLIVPNQNLFRDQSYVYFVHSYYASVSNATVAQSNYAGVTFSAAVQCGNVYGAQFHPEKSGEEGLDILRRFLQ